MVKKILVPNTKKIKKSNCDSLFLDIALLPKDVNLPEFDQVSVECCRDIQEIRDLCEEFDFEVEADTITEIPSKNTQIVKKSILQDFDVEKLIIKMVDLVFEGEDQCWERRQKKLQSAKSSEDTEEQREYMGNNSNFIFKQLTNWNI